MKNITKSDVPDDSSSFSCLPEEIAFRILSKLIDFKTLCLCKLVSKHFSRIVLQVDTILFTSSLRSYWSAISCFKKFGNVKSLCIQHSSSFDTDSLFKWKIKFGNRLDSILFLSPNSVYHNKELYDNKNGHEQEDEDWESENKKLDILKQCLEDVLTRIKLFLLVILEIVVDMRKVNSLKLTALKAILKPWSKNLRHKLVQESDFLTKHLEELDLKAEIGILSESDCNLSPSKEFKLSKGLRQGDPLSPFLFIIAMEALHIALMEAREKGVFKGVEVGKNKAEISHIQYADDALLVGEWSEIIITNLIRILRCFQVSSGLKVNLNKSRLMGVEVKNDEFKRVARSIKCKNGSLPFIYLGLPVGSSMRKITSWEPIVSKLHLKLAKWKAKSLSFGGRLTLIKAVVVGNHNPINLCRAAIINRLEHIRRKFFWHGAVEEKKVSWVAWSKVAAHVKSGGLRIGSLKDFNLSLLSKWLWRWHTDKDALWYHTLHSIHGPNEGDFLNYTSIVTKGSWYDILKVCHDVNSLNIPLSSFFTRSIGEGVSIKFWDKEWLEKEEMESLACLLEGVELKSGPDGWCWSLESSGKFSLKSLRVKLDEKILSLSHEKTRWNSLVPKR
nr:putative RNA-directed DNA polymerase, eukaryota, reverse transcriptase zinc-binding domain protein [Tanacetum cinerariifolium]